MPKRVITGATVDAYDNGDGPQPARLSLHIGWDNNMPDGGIQVGVHVTDPETGLPRVMGPFVELDWASVNRAIRGLREARDGAYGKPE